MRELQLSLSKTQKVRLDDAITKLSTINSSANASVTVADTIPVHNEDSILKGHGTSELDGEVVATVCGVVERVDKLIYVRSLRARYKPETGDIVVGRVVEVAQKRWRVEINFSQDAVFMLSSINIDDTQRRQNAADELLMRQKFVENDVICAEVRGFQHDGSLHLQGRSLKYGKMERGQLLTAPPYLVKRSKQHFHYFEQHNIDLVLGCNGFIWVGEHDDQEIKNLQNSESEQEQSHTPLETRQMIIRISNAVRVLSSLGFLLNVEAIRDIVDLSLSLNIEIHDMLGAEFYVQVAEKEAERRSSSRRKRR